MYPQYFHRKDINGNTNNGISHMWYLGICWGNHRGYIQVCNH